jgi:hypothetical protein
MTTIVVILLSFLVRSCFMPLPQLLPPQPVLRLVNLILRSSLT